MGGVEHEVRWKRRLMVMIWRVKLRGTLAVALLACCPAFAQQFELDPDALKQAIGVAQQWAEENIDPDVLTNLPAVDRDKVEQFLREYQAGLHTNYVLDLAKLKTGARTVLPLLETYEETEPYAFWLRSRLDYFDLADELQRLTPVPPKVRGEPPKPLPNPTTEAARKAWEAKLRASAWPKAAAELVPKLKPVFAAENVPSELVWIAEVESSFNARARSPVGAAGLFQIMPATAKRFGLSSFPFDQRYQPEPSARAAAQYLRFLRGKFKDWPLALAAYNSGEGTVQRLLEKHNARTFDKISTHLPAETQLYVPRIEATLQRREGLKLAQLPATEGKPLKR
jgi:membrane-bound lytic murein transglycosylase D